MVYQVGSALLSFGAVWLITRHLGSEGYGGIIAIIAASQVAQILVNWTSVAVVRFGVDEFIETEKIARTFWLRFVVLAANLVLVAALSPFWFPTLADWLKLTPESFWLVMTHFTVTSLWIHVQMSLQGAKMPRVQGFLQMIERLVIFAGIIILTVSARFTPYSVMLCYIAAPAAAMFWGVFELRRYIWARFSVDRAFVRKFVTYSLPLLPFSLVGYFSGSYVDAIFVSKFLSTSDLGIYSVATQINGIALQLPTLANSLLLPLFVTLQRETENQRSFNYFRNVLPTLTLLWGLACTTLAFVAYFAIPLVFGSEFQAATMPLWILLTASGLSAPILFGYSAYSHAVSATYISTAAGVASAISNILLNYLLIPRFGIVGCAWATLFSFVASGLVVVALTRRIERFPFSWMFYSIVPVVLAVCTFSLSYNSFAGFGVCVAATVVIAYYFGKSFIQAAEIIRHLSVR